MKTRKAKIFTVILTVMLFLNLMQYTAVPVAAGENNRLVRVGFFAFPGYHEIENGLRCGYGFDFLTLLQRYTDLKYEFVGYDRSWSDMQQMLLDGEIDLVTSARKTLEREEKFDYSEPIGANKARINVRIDDERFIPGDYSALNGITIGLLTDNSRNADLESFAREKGFTYKVKEYSKSDELSQALHDGSVDAISTSSLRKTTGEKVIAEYAPQEFYVIVRKGDSELLNEINYGIGQMDLNEGNWRDDLAYKNYDSKSSDSIAFTKKERDYIAAVRSGEKTITVAAQPDANPYSFVEDGSLTGIIPDYFAHLMEMAGLPYTTAVAKDREEFHEWVTSNYTDVIMDFRFGSNMSEMNDFGLLTDSFLELTTSRVTRKGFSGNVNSIAYVDSWSYENIAENPEKVQLIPCNSREEAMEAVNKGYADVCYVYTYTAEKFINTDPDSRLQANILKTPVYSEYIYISPDTDHELCSILNKCIKMNTSGVLDEYVKKYTTVTYSDVSLFMFLTTHPEYILLALMAMTVIAVLILMAVVRGRAAKQKSNQLIREMEQQLKLEESLTFTNFFLDTYVSAYFVNLDTLDCRVYKRTAELEKEFPIVGDYFESLTEYIGKCVHPDDREELRNVSEPERMKQFLKQQPQYVHLFRDISGGVEKMYKMQVIRGADDAHAAFGFLDVTEEVKEQQKHFLGAIPLSPDVLNKANIGLWAFELDEGKAPRMYADDTMCGLLGLKHQVSPEETYHAWYDNIYEDSYELVTESVDKMSAGIHAEVQYPWHHPDGGTVIVRCGGVRNYEYTNGIRIEGTHQNVTEVLHYDEDEKRKKRDELVLTVMSALSEEYATLYYICADTGEYQLITRDNEFGNKVNVRLAHGGDFYEDSRISTQRVIYEEDRTRMGVFSEKDSMEKAFGGQDSFSLDYRLVIDDLPVWYRVKTVKIPGDDTERYYALGIMRIQENMEQQKQLRKNREIIEILASEYSSVYYVDLSTEGLDTYTMNEETESEFGQMFRSGINYSDAFKMYVDNLVYSEDKEMMLIAGSITNIQKELADKKAFITTYRSDNDGTLHYCEMKFVKVGEDEKPSAAVLAFADKDEEIRAELQRKEIAARDAAVISGLSDDFGCVVYVDFETGEEIHYRFDPLLMANIPDWDKITVFDERIKTLAEKLIHPDDMGFFADPSKTKPEILEIVNREGVFYRNFRVVIQDEIKYYQLKIVRDDNLANHVIAGLRNIDDTAKRELEYQEKLELANKSKTDFLFNMSHDIRTPMNAIIGFTQLAKKYIDDKERTLDSLNKIESSGNHLLELINEVLDMSRVEAGKLRSDMKTVVVSDAAKRLVTICQENAVQRNISMEYNEKNIIHPVVVADELHINQIVMNILGNSVKYTQPGGHIYYSVEETDSEIHGYGRYVITVEDTGIGMSPEFLKHIFESFSREEKVTTSEIQGTGLGMSIVKRLVDYMDGTIDIESEQGRGTKVTVTLHLKLADASAEVQTEENEELKVDLEGKKVLLVEDNTLNREIASDMLEEHGMIIEEAVNGIDAVGHVKERGADFYDVILMDIQMPLMNGFEATTEIRKLPGTGKIPIIALSANAFEEDKAKSVEAGMNDHVSKPIVISKLINVLAKYL